MQNIKLDLSYTGITEKEISKYATKVKKIYNKLNEISEDENEFVGWLKLPSNYDKKEFSKIKKIAKKIRKESEVFVVIGIGGSYLGARAVIESLTSNFANMFPDKIRKSPQIFFVGNSISPNYINELIDCIGNKDISINVISKSGTTTEPAIAFRIFREFLENKYGADEAANRIYVTTDKKKGALKELADQEEYETFVIPDNIGGRFSVLTAVGLLPIAVAGIDIDKLMEGAKNAECNYSDDSIKYNQCYRYAVVRNILYQKDKTIEILANYEPKLHYFTEWWKQLYGESEGKGHKGIFPAGVDLSTDLHSMGQYIQDGKRNLFETVINVEETKTDIKIKRDEDNVDGLNFLAGKTMDYVNKKAMQGTIEAHVSGGVPNIIINIKKLDEETIGELIYFFELACAVSGNILGVNPFDQPGVEAYKNNMFRLLEKPGYEKERPDVRS
ncbi:MAG: glucose-6-phosphate isomerase [Clostridia bacterium]|nr:glucose-6-phosphate isomerase [Clostridia bacterium]